MMGGNGKKKLTQTEQTCCKANALTTFFFKKYMFMLK